jgi:hypothetical protein
MQLHIFMFVIFFLSILHTLCYQYLHFDARPNILVYNIYTINNWGVIFPNPTQCGACWKRVVDLSKEFVARLLLPEATLGGSSSRLYWITKINRNVGIGTAEVNRLLPKLTAGELQIWTLDKSADQRWSQNFSIHILFQGHILFADQITFQGHILFADQITFQGPGPNYIRGPNYILFTGTRSWCRVAIVICLYDFFLKLKFH